MFIKIKLEIKTLTFLILAALLSLMLVPLAFNGIVSAEKADIKGSLCKGTDDLELGAAKSCDSVNANDNGLNKLITQIINIFSVIVGIIAVIMVIYGGLKFITSGGDSGRLTSAKQTILYAIIGLIIVALAQFVVKFVLSKANNSTT